VIAATFINTDITERKKAEVAIKESELQYKSTIDSMSSAIHVVDKDFTILVMNQRFIEWNEELGLETESIGRNLFDIFSFLPDEVKNEYQKVFDTGESLATEENMEVAGKDFITETTKIPVFEGDKVDRIVTVINDITGRKRSEEALIESQKRYSKLIEESPECIITLDPDGTFTSINPEGERLFGYSPDEIIGKNFFETELLPPNQMEVAINEFQEALETRTTKAQEWKVFTRDKELLAVDIAATLIMEKEEISQILVTIRDVSERKKAEEARKRNAERLEILHEIDQSLLAARSIDEIVQTALKGILDLVAFERVSVALFNNEQETVHFIAVIKEDDKTTGSDITFPLDEFEVPEEVKKGGVRIIEDLSTVEEVSNITQMLKNAGIRSILNVPITVHKELIGILNLGREVPGTFSPEDVDVANEMADSLAVAIFSRQAEEALKVSEEHFRALIENAPDVVMTVDENGEISFISPSVEKVLGYKTEELVGTSGFEMGHPDDLPFMMESFSELFENPKNPITIQFRVKHKDGSWRVVEATGSNLLAVPSVECIVVNYMDITERKEAVKALRESEERFRNIFENATIGIYRTTSEGKVVMANPALLEMLGYDSLEELENINLEEEGFAPDYRRSDFKELIENEGSVKGLETSWTKKDGSVVHIRESARAVWDEGENAHYYEGTVEDVTKRKKAELELERYQKHLEELVKERTQALEQSNAELEAFAYSVSHDLRAPLRAMHGFSTALKEDYCDKLDEKGKEYADRILSASKNMDKLIQDLLMYSRLTTSEFEMDILGLDRTLNEAMTQMEAEIKEKNADIQVKKPLPEVVGNPTTLILILGNILNNAIKFHAPGKRPKVKIWAKEKDGMVRLYIKDNGIGIDPKYGEKIFRVFERLHGKNHYPGTGIGLAIVKKGVERMGGSVGFKSTLGKETTFWIDLPKPEGKE
jgi:PAS domain S-box-containing protein